MDLVVNHTSDEHDWFKEALANPDSKYGDYYIFKEGVNGLPPNNWRSYFGSSAWESVPGEENVYYLHAFTKKQPDLNWENPVVREEIYAMINYWLDQGLSGFRIDAILNIKKRLEVGQFEPDGEDGLAFIGNWILNQPGIGTWLKELNEQTFKPHNSMTVAEADVPEERLKEYIGSDGYFSMVFDFSYTDIDVPNTGEWYKFSNWTWEEMKANLYNSQLVTQENGWAAVYLENHDQPRSINKYIPEKDRNKYSKKMLGTLFMLLRGTPFIYQGQEIGMTNVHMSNLEEYDDIATHDQYNRALLAGLTAEKAMAAMNRRSRDNSRTPMQWSNEKNAGFSVSEKTWLKLNTNYPTINVEEERKTSSSVLNYYKQLIQLRRDSQYKEVIVYGEFRPIEHPDVIMYKRVIETSEVLVIVNYSNSEQAVQVDDQFSTILLTNYESDNQVESKLILRPYESVVLSNF
ncbi:oligo-1,6-glucosidase [Enterococcus sp. AZ194]|uniref:alpha-amylase family glycosyl hydrolase n=1 Tax=Enterococcus sp. AZ194 TaxID=2774629 RepID=UPI003F2182ED